MNARHRARARTALYRLHTEIDELNWLLHESAATRTPVTLAAHEQRALTQIGEAYKVLNEWARSLPL